MTFAFDSIAQTIKPIPYQTQQRCYGSNLPAGESDSCPAESYHIEILYFIDLLRIGPVPAYTLFVYLPLVGRCKVFQYGD
jgi:hypothetical protein